MGGQGESGHFGATRRAFPVIDANHPNQCRALNGRDEFCLAAVAVPCAYKTLAKIGYGVEPLDSVETKIIYKTNLASVIDHQTAGQKNGLSVKSGRRVHCSYKPLRNGA